VAYADYTLTTLRSRLQERVEASAFYSTAELDLAINETIRLWNLYTGTWRRRVTHALQVSSHPYIALPQTMVFPMRIEVDGVPLNKGSLWDLDYGHPGWEAETTGDGGTVPTTPNVWAPASLNLIAVWPRVAATGQTLTIDGVSAAPVLSSAGSFIDLNPSRVNTLLDYAKHYLSIKRGSDEMSLTTAAHQGLIVAAGDENALFRESSFFRWAMAQQDKQKFTPLHAPVKK
jgi:hypothetical protein